MSGAPFCRKEFAASRYLINAAAFVFYFVVTTLIHPHPQRACTPHTLTGDFRMHEKFRSQFLPTARNIIVYLPPGYERETYKRYPILYLHDGQNLFDGATSYIPGQEWRVDETAQHLIESREIEPLIIVGIYNAGTERVNEYTPTRDARIKMGGQAHLYGRMIVEELMPFINRTYRTLHGAENAGLGGSSLGGLATLHLGLKYPHVFGRLAVISPSVWWDGREIVREVEALPHKTHSRIWLDIGTAESNSPTQNEVTVANARLLRDALVGKGWREGADLRYFEAEGAPHSEHAWAERVAPILKFLFPK